MFKEYKLIYTKSSQTDVKAMRRYIIDKFKYIGLAKNFDSKISHSLKVIRRAPDVYKTTGFYYRGYEIYMRCIDSYLFFYIVEETAIVLLRVLKDGMNWEYIIKMWLRQSGY